MTDLHRIAAVAAFAALAAPAFVASAKAQDYPTRTIRIISPVPAGGLSDIAMRPMAIELSKRWGQPVIIENRAGANGMLAGRACAQAAPDGYTICNLFNDTVLNAPFLFKTVGYDPRKDFTPITNGYFITAGFFAAPSVPVNTLPDLIELSKKTPGGLNMARAGDHHRHVHPPLQHRYRLELRHHSLQERQRSRERPADQLGAGGEQRRRQSDPADPGRPFQGGRARFAGAAGAAARHPDAEGAQARTDPHQGVVRLFRPGRLPPAIVKKLHDEIVSIYSEPLMRERALLNAGLEPILNTPEEFARFIEVDWDRTAKQMKLIGATPQ